MVADRPALEQAVLYELREAVAEDVRGDAEVALHLGKRRRPKKTSRMTSSVQRSPTIASAAAIEQFCSVKGRYGMAPS